MKEAQLFGGVEAGGTKFNCVVATTPGDVLERETFPTTTPEQTLERVIAFFEQAQRRQGPLAALGLASFGPAGVNPGAADFGYITTTPKPHWSQTDIRGRLQRALQVPVAFDTDVNGAAWGEAYLGAARAVDNYIYVTIGTGVGAGIVANGQPVNGAMHPEIGHMLLPRGNDAQNFEGNCPFHGDCLEGLVAGPALKRRWGDDIIGFGEQHPAWALQAHYTALMCVNLTLCYAPEKIIIGGGVMDQTHLYPKIRDRFAELMNGYPCSANEALDTFIVPPELGAPGEVGAILMAQKLSEQQRRPDMKVSV